MVHRLGPARVWCWARVADCGASACSRSASGVAPRHGLAVVRGVGLCCRDGQRQLDCPMKVCRRRTVEQAAGAQPNSRARFFHSARCRRGRAAARLARGAACRSVLVVGCICAGLVVSFAFCFVPPSDPTAGPTRHRAARTTCFAPGCSRAPADRGVHRCPFAFTEGRANDGSRRRGERSPGQPRCSASRSFSRFVTLDDHRPGLAAARCLTGFGR